MLAYCICFTWLGNIHYAFLPSEVNCLQSEDYCCTKSSNDASMLDNGKRNATIMLDSTAFIAEESSFPRQI